MGSSSPTPIPFFPSPFFFFFLYLFFSFFLYLFIIIFFFFYFIFFFFVFIFFNEQRHEVKWKNPTSTRCQKDDAPTSIYRYNAKLTVVRHLTAGLGCLLGVVYKKISWTGSYQKKRKENNTKISIKKIISFWLCWPNTPALLPHVIWLVGCFWFNGPLRQYFSLYRAVSQRQGERKGNDRWEKKMSKQPPPAPTASAISPCPTIIQTSRTLQHCMFTQHPRSTRPRPATCECPMWPNIVFSKKYKFISFFDRYNIPKSYIT